MTGNLVLTLLLGFLIGINLSCSSVPKFPTSTLIEYDAKNKVCGKYRITDPEHFKFEYVGDIQCPDIFGFTASDIPKVLDWGQDLIDYGKQHCN